MSGFEKKGIKMSNMAIRKNQANLAESLYKKTHFSKHEVEQLLIQYREVSKGGEKIDRTTFRDFLTQTFSMTDDILMDRVFKAFDISAHNYVDPCDWVLGLSVVLRGDFKEQAKYCFSVYDLNGDGIISREEMFQLLKNCQVNQAQDEDPEEGPKELVDQALKLLDTDKDGKVTLEDFEKAVEKNHLLIELLGGCIADEKCIEAFEATFADANSTRPHYGLQKT